MTVALALAHSAKQQPFNADFYVAAATVIPVLFLAIAVQSSLYQDLVKLFIRASNRPPSPFSSSSARRRSGSPYSYSYTGSQARSLP